MNRLEAPTLPPWLARMLPFERYRVDLGEHRVHVMEAGDPRGRPVLLLHGNPTWGFVYRNIVKQLVGPKGDGARGLRFIMPDLVGLGFSDKPTHASAHTLENHRGWMRALIEALKLEDAIFVGQDWGGPIGLAALGELAAREGRARMTGLVLLNTVVSPPRPGFKATAFHRFARMPLVSDLAFRLFGVPQVMLHTVQGNRRSISGDVARAYRLPLETWTERVAPLALARMVPNTLAHPSIPELERVHAFATAFEGPKAIVWGDRDPVLGRVRSWMEKIFPDAELTRTEGGHFVQEEAPREIADAILSVARRSGSRR